MRIPDTATAGIFSGAGMRDVEVGGGEKPKESCYILAYRT
jgi:hypothetical protein